MTNCLTKAPGKPRPGAEGLCDYFAGLPGEELEARHRAVDAAIMAAGITFTVYSEAGNIDRAWPFDVVPRIIEKAEWDRRVEAGLKQRLIALNRFIDDIYHDQNIIKDGVFPAEVLADPRIQELRRKRLSLESHIGPIAYVVRMVNVPQDTMVFYAIMLLVFVADPLAVTLTIACNMALIRFWDVKRPRFRARADNQAPGILESLVERDTFGGDACLSRNL